MAKTPTQVKRAIARYIASLRRHIRVDAVILFGSYAVGHPHEWSDIDLAIISPDFDGKDLFRRVKLMAKARAERDIDIEALGYGKKEFDSAHRQTFLGEVIRKGKIVYQSPRLKRRRHALKQRETTSARA